MAQSTRPLPVLLIAETRPTVAAGLKLFLADIPDIQPVAVMAGYDHVVDYAEHHDIKLIIVGQGMNGATPLNEFRRLRQKNPSWRLVLLADLADRDTIMAGLSAGASGIIPTSVEKDELNSAITRILAGNIYFPNTLASLEQQRPAWPSCVASSQLQPSLTPRQFEVLGVLAQGNSNKQIAQILQISDSTVSMHLNAAFRALQVRDRTSAAMAFRNLNFPDQEARHDRISKITQSRAGRHLFS